MEVNGELLSDTLKLGKRKGPMAVRVRDKYKKPLS